MILYLSFRKQHTEIRRKTGSNERYLKCYRNNTASVHLAIKCTVVGRFRNSVEG